MRRAALVLALALSALHAPRAARAQFGERDPTPRAATAFAALSGNALIGGATAAARAAASRRDPLRAFARGAFGGAVHFGGKWAASRGGSLAGVGGVALGAVGTAAVANAARGAGALDALFLPVGPLRVRWERADSAGPRRVRLALNAAEAVILAHGVGRDGMALDWRRSAEAGAFVFVARGRLIEIDGATYRGIAGGSVVVLSDLGGPLTSIARHEAVHAQQQWFVQEAWVRPAERRLRRLPGLRRIPSWVEPGVLGLALDWVEYEVFDTPYGPLSRLGESEAELLGRR